MSNEAVLLKLYKEGMVVYINDEDMDFDIVSEIVCEKFSKSKSFFSGLSVKVGFKGRSLTEEQERKLIERITETVGCKAELWKQPEPEEETVEKSEENLSGEQILENAFKMAVEDEFTKFYTKTIRSGQLLESVGNIVVIGDVNPGAELVAAGNIVVMGTVKGTVHAGVMGNRSAVVAAINLSPTQLRIADIIACSPDEDEGLHGLAPELAYVKDGNIFIEEILQKRK